MLRLRIASHLHGDVRDTTFRGRALLAIRIVLVCGKLYVATLTVNSQIYDVMVLLFALGRLLLTTTFVVAGFHKAQNVAAVVPIFQKYMTDAGILEKLVNLTQFSPQDIALAATWGTTAWELLGALQ